MKPLAQNTLIQNRYLIVQLIGKGGMGEVYLAVDQRLGSAVALKRTFFAGDEMLSNAFEREARILARMRHPVLPKVSDHFSEGDEQYLVMEHISGDDLAKRLEAAQKAFPLSWVMFWADQLLDALSYLHSHEPPIIHRDIKPQNLKLTDENHVILLDFGLSKNSTALTKSNSSGSSTGSVVGYTPHYAPMEQIRGIGTNPRSDIYSLSATLYQLLTNVVPPDALSRADTMLNGSKDPITSPNEINSDVPVPVSEVLLQGMEVSQEKRFGTAREMQKALRKAHAQMQEVMSANTVVMTAEGTSNSESEPVGVPMDKTEVMDFAASPILSVPTAVGGSTGASEAQTNLVSQPETPAFDPNATMAYDANGTPSIPRQSDVKTEVFLAGSNSFPVPSDPTPVVADAAPVSEFAEPQDFNPASDGEDYSEAEPSYVADATMANIAYEGTGFTDSASGTDQYTESADIGSDQIPSGFEAAASSDPNIGAYSSNDAAFAPTPAPVIAKKSGGKVFAVVAGLLVLLVLGAAALGGGWYYYNNYYAVAKPEPSPSPSPSVEPTSEPPIDFGASNTDNSNVATASDTNTNSNTNDSDLTVGPTPVEPETGSTSSETVATRPERPNQTSTKKETRPAVPPGGKATPKPTTTTRDRKKILQ